MTQTKFTHRPVNLALVQLRNATGGLESDCEHMCETVRQAVQQGIESGKRVDMVMLPELWNTKNGHEWFRKNAESIPELGVATAEWPQEAITVRYLTKIAKELNVWLVGGTIPERDGNDCYNTATVWSPEGELVTKYRKTHLFDLCLPKMTFKESDSFKGGDKLVCFQTPFGKFGIAICYDIRFAEIAVLAARQGCMAMLYPAAFNTHTGPLHWELLQRARALDNQIFVATCSPARDEKAGYVVYGHSMAVSPMGAVIATAQTEESIVHATLEPQIMEDTRAGIPLLPQRRFDLYPDISRVKA